MRSIGFRCEKHDFSYVVLEGSRDAPVLVEREKLQAPSGAARADQLVWLRREIHGLLGRTQPDVGAYKRTETIVKKLITERLEFEGVLQEACRSHPSRIDLRGILRQQVARELKFKGKAREVNAYLDEVGLNNSNTGTYADAALVALIGLTA